MPFNKLFEKVEHAGGFLWAHGKLRLEQPNQVTTAHPPSQTVAHKENSRFEVDKERQRLPVNGLACGSA
jgi:hypothetical protein